LVFDLGILFLEIFVLVDVFFVLEKYNILNVYLENYVCLPVFERIEINSS